MPRGTTSVACCHPAVRGATPRTAQLPRSWGIGRPVLIDTPIVAPQARGHWCPMPRTPDYCGRRALPSAELRISGGHATGALLPQMADIGGGGLLGGWREQPVVARPDGDLGAG